MSLVKRQSRKLVTEIVGVKGIKVLESIGSSEVTDEKIQTKTGFELNVIRSLLNQLHYIGLIDYNREKDKKTNWYTYTWFVNKEKIEGLVHASLRKRLVELEESLDEESNYVFFRCVNGCEKLPFELAAEYDFKCPECGSNMEHVDNKKVIKGVIDEIKEVRKSLEKFDSK